MFRFLSLKRLLVFSLLLIFPILLFGQDAQDDTTINLSFAVKHYERFISITITAGKNANLKVPTEKTMYIGFSSDEKSDCYFEVKEVASNESMEHNPLVDYENVTPAATLITLKNGESISYDNDFFLFYKFDLNKRYKIRAIYKSSKYNKGKDIYSDWLYLKPEWLQTP